MMEEPRKRGVALMKEAAHASVKALSVVEMAKRMSRGEETSEMKLRWCV